MLYHALRRLSAHPHRFHAGTRTFLMLTFLAFVGSLLASCGSATAAVNPSSATPTQVVTPTLRPTSGLMPTPTHTPKPTPKPTHVPTATPTPVPVQTAPAILDLQPASMSIIGHLDCQKNGAYVCLARVLSRPNNQSNLNWFASTNVPGHIVFSPSGGNLSPGQSVLVTITVPFNACTSGLFFFHGPINTHTIVWGC
jgi:hypothetical protein